MHLRVPQVSRLVSCWAHPARTRPITSLGRRPGDGWCSAGRRADTSRGTFARRQCGVSRKRATPAPVTRMASRRRRTGSSLAAYQQTVRVAGFVAMHRRLLSASAMAVATALSTVSPSRADEAGLHHVKYTVSAHNPTSADIYYRDADPPTWADYSHDPYVFSPKVEADIGPDTAWVLEAWLADPGQWGRVQAPSGMAFDRPELPCRFLGD